MSAELPFDIGMVVVPLPGSVLVDSLIYSRSLLCSDSHGYLQTDDSIKWDDTRHMVLSIAGQSVQPNKLYQCAVPYDLLIEGMYEIKPLHQYAKQPNKIRSPPFIAHVDSQIVIKKVFVQHYADKILAQISTNTSVTNSSSKKEHYYTVKCETDKVWNHLRNEHDKGPLSHSCITTVVEHSGVE